MGYSNLKKLFSYLTKLKAI